MVPGQEDMKNEPDGRSPSAGMGRPAHRDEDPLVALVEAIRSLLFASSRLARFADARAQTGEPDLHEAAGQLLAHACALGEELSRGLNDLDGRLRGGVADDQSVEQDRFMATLYLPLLKLTARSEAVFLLLNSEAPVTPAAQKAWNEWKERLAWLQ
jgi:hypothetical protein